MGVFAPLRLISLNLAVGLSILYTFIYVAVLYLHPLARPTRHMTKDHPSVIRARIVLVTFASLVTSILTVYIGKAEHTSWLTSGTRILALHFSTSGIIYSMVVTAVLFAGPLYEYLIAEGGLFTFPRDVTRAFGSLIGIRNYIAGPVSEELVFRSCIIPLHIFAGVPVGKIILLTPLYFGLAHIHHIHERTRTRPGHLLEACVISLAQFGYTTIFGWYASYLFIKTGSVWACVVVHAMCNSLGLPRVTGRVEGPWIHSIIYYILLITGALGAARLISLQHDSSSTAYQPYLLI